jgi:hypothetical protein
MGLVSTENAFLGLLVAPLRKCERKPELGPLLTIDFSAFGIDRGTLFCFASVQSY